MISGFDEVINVNYKVMEVKKASCYLSVRYKITGGWMIVFYRGGIRFQHSKGVIFLEKIPKKKF
jgi:hypothetical protein